MEVILMWLDELDDLCALLRQACVPLMQFMAAMALFALTGLLLLRWPWLVSVPLCVVALWRLRKTRLLLRSYS